MPFSTDDSSSSMTALRAWSLVWGWGFGLVRRGVGEDFGNGSLGCVLCSMCFRFCFSFRFCCLRLFVVSWGERRLHEERDSLRVMSINRGGEKKNGQRAWKLSYRKKCLTISLLSNTNFNWVAGFHFPPEYSCKL